MAGESLYSIVKTFGVLGTTECIIFDPSKIQQG